MRKGISRISRASEVRNIMSEIIGGVPAFVVSVFVVLACALYALDAYITSGHTQNEPPMEKTSIPLIGHALGLLTNGTTYFGKLR